MDIYLFNIKIRKAFLRKHYKGKAKVLKKNIDGFKNIFKKHYEQKRNKKG